MPVIDIGRALGLWSGWVNRRAKLIVLVWLALALAGGYYTAGHLTMQTSTEEMLSPDLPFRKLRQEFNAAFPVLDGNVAILVTGATAQTTLSVSVFYEHGLPSIPPSIMLAPDEFGVWNGVWSGTWGGGTVFSEGDTRLLNTMDREPHLSAEVVLTHQAPVQVDLRDFELRYIPIERQVA